MMRVGESYKPLDYVTDKFHGPRTITHKELDKLIKGEITIEDIYDLKR